MQKNLADRFGIPKIYQELLLVFILFCSFSRYVYAQDLRVKRLNNDNGLSNSTIECIFQDKRGFIWIGTRDGLNKYDGYNITSYKNQPQNTQSVSDSYITCIFEDSKQQLWIGTKSGLNLFDREKGLFERIDLGKDYKEAISKIVEFSNGNLLIATYGNGLFLVKNYTVKAAKSYALHGLKEKYFFDLHITSDGNLWTSAPSGLYQLSLKKGVFHATKRLNQHNINVISSHNEALWLGTEDDGVIKYLPAQNFTQYFEHDYYSKNSIGSNQVKALLTDKNNHLWIGTINGGLNKLDTKKLLFTNYTNDPNNSNGLSQRTISALLEDNQGNIWIGTHRGGVNIYSPLAEKFKLQRQSSQQNGLNYNDIKSFYEAKDGSIWIGTDGGGINIWSPDRASYSQLKSSPFDKNSLGSNEVLDIMEDGFGDIYVSTWGGGLNKYNPATNSFTRFLNDKNNKHSISGNFVQKAYEDSKNNFWVCTYYSGLNLLDRKTGTFTTLSQGKDGSKLNGNNIISILEDKNENLWIGTDDGGLNRYDLNKQIFVHYLSSEEKSPDIRVIFQDQKQRIWVGQRGLYFYNQKNDDFEPFCTDCPLAEEFIKGILEDKNGFLWISTSNGLTKLDPQNKSLRKYNTADGLQGLEFESNAALKTSSGEMFFGGINGFNNFFPDNIHFNNYIPPLYLTNFQIFNETILPSTKGSPLKADISFTKEIHLSYKQSTFSIGFSALNYIAPENNKYEYILEGFDKSWNPTHENHKAYYTNVPPGDYIFKVKASNNDDIWNAGITLHIHISPPFWETWWFKLSILLACLYVAFLILSFRRNLEIKKLEERKKEEIHQMQLQFFTNISHELRTPLALIMGPIERLIKEDLSNKFGNLYHTIHHNANRLLHLINELMDFRKVESGYLQLRVMPLNLVSFFNEIDEEFRELAAEKNIHFSFNNLSHQEEIWADKQILEKITLNLIINAIKYTSQNGSVKLEISDELHFSNPNLHNELNITNNSITKDYFYLKVVDSGIGISKDSISHLFERYYRITESHMGSGIGLAFVKSLTALHKGNIFVKSERNVGTEIIIAIPCQKKDYQSAEIWSKAEENGGIRLESITDNHYPALPGSNFEEPTRQTEKSYKKILVVDDNEELRTFLKETLITNHIIFEAENGEEGLKVCKEVYPDLIISDVMMPKLNGISFCKRVKDDIEISHIPFMMLTAKSSLEAEIEGKESGADFYFTKPINIDLLEVTLHNIFDQQNKLKEHYQKNYQVQAKELVNNSKDIAFLDKLLSIINKNISNTDLDIEFLCSEVGMSRTKLYQKVKDITGQTIGDFIRTIRLRKAVEIMSEEDVLLTEVIYRVGIQTQSYFTKAFKKEFNKTPSQFLQDLNKKALER